MSTEHAHIEVLAPGFASTLQDLGRSGLRQFGVTCAGAADAWSHALANLLVGNATSAATLEMTLTGPTLRFCAPAVIALSGARIEAWMDTIEIPIGRPIQLQAGATLRLGRCLDGTRSYLAIGGGFPIASTLGSRSTDLRGRFGGLHGSVLKRGDRLPMVAAQRLRDDSLQIARWWVDTHPNPRAESDIRLIRLLPGEVSNADLLAQDWQIDARSNRQGLRLQGEAVDAGDQGTRLSEPVVPGTVQLPPDGQPIVLLSDAQTHGGYLRIGHAIRADWPALAQARPGDRLRFMACTPAQAQAAYRAQQQRLQRLRLAIESRHAQR